ncbi:hypothetical protein L873DRAFT_1845198 [Choiromyces venosus 120613-1]|uniref:Nephrocystin 3-like N-terminal domain-containing protein n=1 Tax=Choiromyces venosus 120613-1 TaxID=1336337 RepID=A0A3N4JEZ7_9PEZI|nr:hypothetical protein L873DRAFT_1845198 [Choiromyces venosus 120613-1]
MAQTPKVLFLVGTVSLPAFILKIMAKNLCSNLQRAGIIDLDHLLDEINWPDPGTGEWLFKDDRYKRWRKSDKSEILWLHGGPGIGKTMLAKHVARKFLKGPGEPLGGVKLVFYFAQPHLSIAGVPPNDAEGLGPIGEEVLEQQVAKVACDLLYGILQQDGNLFDNCKTELENQGVNFFTNPNSLWNVLGKMTKKCPEGPVYFLIDGLDALEKRVCGKLISRIQGLITRTKRPVKLFVTGRNVPRVTYLLGRRFNEINLDDNENVGVDVKSFIRNRMNALGGWQDRQKDGATEMILKMSGRTFLWASLVIDHLKLDCSGPQYEKYLSKFPEKLGSLYKKMLEEVQLQEGSERILKIIQSVALAFRPLTFGELGHILECIEKEEAGTGKLDSHGRTNVEPLERTADIRQYVRSSRAFLRAGDISVSIVHHTATEYLFDENRRESLQMPPKSTFDLTVSWECFQYLHSALAGSQEMPKDFRDLVAKWPYLNYAAESWVLHARRSAELNDKLWDDSDRNWLQHKFFEPSDAVRKPWIKLCGDQKMEILEGEQTPLHIVVCLGLMPLVEKALLFFESGTQETNKYQSPLHLAAKFMSKTYQILIDKGSPSLLTAQDQDGNTPLHQAASSGYWPMLVALVEKFRTPEYKTYSNEINKQNHSGNTPLHLAFQFDHPKMVEFLVSKGAKPTIVNQSGDTATQLGKKLGRGDSLDILKQAGFVKETEGEIQENPGEEKEEKPEEEKEEKLGKESEEKLGKDSEEKPGGGGGENSEMVYPNEMADTGRKAATEILAQTKEGKKAESADVIDGEKGEKGEEEIKEEIKKEIKKEIKEEIKKEIKKEIKEEIGNGECEREATTEPIPFHEWPAPVRACIFFYILLVILTYL